MSKNRNPLGKKVAPDEAEKQINTRLFSVAQINAAGTTCRLFEDAKIPSFSLAGAKSQSNMMTPTQNKKTKSNGKLREGKSSEK